MKMEDSVGNGQRECVYDDFMDLTIVSHANCRVNAVFSPISILQTICGIEALRALHSNARDYQGTFDAS